MTHNVGDSGDRAGLHRHLHTGHMHRKNRPASATKQGKCTAKHHYQKPHALTMPHWPRSPCGDRSWSVPAALDLQARPRERSASTATVLLPRPQLPPPLPLPRLPQPPPQMFESDGRSPSGDSSKAYHRFASPGCSWSTSMLQFWRTTHGSRSCSSGSSTAAAETRPRTMPRLPSDIQLSCRDRLAVPES